MSNYLLISDAAREVKVESHVLRYWEEELHLPIKRNELGHRYYTKEDIERFKQIKSMKERGLQLKAIKMILKDGRLDVLPQEESENGQAGCAENLENRTSIDNREDHQSLDEEKESDNTEECENKRNIMPIDIVACRSKNNAMMESREEKAKRLQWLLQQMIRETLRENNQELSREIKESIVKELDYQFRSQEEREEEREQKRSLRDEDYYRRMDELLRKKSKRPFLVLGGKEKASRKDKEETGEKQRGEEDRRKKGDIREIGREPERQEAVTRKGRKR